MGLKPFNKDLPVNEIHIKFFVPSTKRSTEIPKQQFERRIEISKRKINSLFGGSTRWRGIGSFRFRGKDIEEKVGIIEAFTTSSYSWGLSLFFFRFFSFLSRNNLVCLALLLPPISFY